MFALEYLARECVERRHRIRKLMGLGKAIQPMPHSFLQVDSLVGIFPRPLSGKLAAVW